MVSAGVVKGQREVWRATVLTCADEAVLILEPGRNGATATPGIFHDSSKADT